MHCFIIFGFVQLQPHEQTKFTAQPAICVFVGYNMYIKDIYYITKLGRIRISRNVTFLERVYYFASISIIPRFPYAYFKILMCLILRKAKPQTNQLIDQLKSNGYILLILWLFGITNKAMILVKSAYPLGCQKLLIGF